VLYLDEELLPGRTVHLTGGEAEHARRSLRIRSGDPVAIVDGRGSRARGQVIGFGKRSVEVSLARIERVPAWPRHRISLAAGILRSSRMDFLVEKASELGVSRFIPLVLDRSVARPSAEGTKEDRWHRLAVESLKQCRRARLMEVALPQELGPFLAEVSAEAAVWMADPAGQDPLRVGMPAGDPELVLVVGPEGGLTEREQAVLRARGAAPVGLGAHRLRAETAATVLLSSALARLGELGSPTVVDPEAPLPYS
jgi:16S rRNA (uracil1498-N3)-methyltransferase